MVPECPTPPSEHESQPEMRPRALNTSADRYVGASPERISSGPSAIEAAMLPARLRAYSLVLSSPTENMAKGAWSDLEGHQEEVVVEYVREGTRSYPLTSWLGCVSWRKTSIGNCFHPEGCAHSCRFSRRPPPPRSLIERRRQVPPWSETWAKLCGGSDTGVGLADWEAIRAMDGSTREVGDLNLVSFEYGGS